METAYWKEIILKWKMEQGYTYQIAQPHHNFCRWKLLTRNKKWKIEKKVTEYSVIFKVLIANYSKMTLLSVNTIILLWSTEVKN